MATVTNKTSLYVGCPCLSGYLLTRTVNRRRKSAQRLKLNNKQPQSLEAGVNMRCYCHLHLTHKIKEDLSVINNEKDVDNNAMATHQH